MSERFSEDREFDPTALQWATVECTGCDKRFVCTPYSDYYGSRGITNDDGVFIDGECEECLLANNGFVHSEEITQVSPHLGIIGEES